MRLFDLRAGRIVFIAPQCDGSLRSLQVDPAAIYSLADVESVLDRALSEAAVQRFLAAPGNI